MIHRDIKCQNILISSDGTLKVGDLGLLTYDKDGENVEYAGTQAYFAPEVVRERKYGAKIDVWALGCVMYYLATFTHPFYSPYYLELIKNIVQRDPEELANYSDDFSALIHKMLSKSPNERPSAKEILEYAGAKLASSKCIKTNQILELNQNKASFSKQALPKPNYSKYKVQAKVFSKTRASFLGKSTSQKDAQVEGKRVLTAVKPCRTEVLRVKTSSLLPAICSPVRTVSRDYSYNRRCRPKLTILNLA
eukprot:TRINITY_DN7851_c0_g1_i11.p1 TRINITY_DN7851_c0_g1~~TRINITY_DN7851_c0_g1_i11.p1  ORF type:complete len:250 (-),score=28.70 TRINITY_DN7851_c0_g1_i11:122-871(-)